MIFSLELDIFGGGCIGDTTKQRKMSAFSEDFLNEDDFEAALATFCCYYYGVNTYEAIEKIATDQKDYHESTLGVIVCCIAKADYQKQ